MTQATSQISDKEKQALLKNTKNRMTIHLGYRQVLVLPWDAGTKLLETIAHAEFLDESDWDCPKITPIPKDVDFTASTLSEKRYLDYKMSQLLGTKVET